MSKNEEREQRARDMLSRAFKREGWEVHHPQPRGDRHWRDLVVSTGGVSYVIELKAASEGRSDRLVPLWAQAYLQAAKVAGPDDVPLAIVVAPSISSGVAEQILDFAADHAPSAPSGVMDLTGAKWFRGQGLYSLNEEGTKQEALSSVARRAGGNLFTDLNQWLLKVLIAPELPEDLLAAPRGRYEGASDLARAADVSAMTGSRFIRQLEREGFLDPAASELALVRREELFSAWRVSAGQRVKEADFQALLSGDPAVRVNALVEGREACMALFAAAEELNFGHVEGVPPHIYVRKLSEVVRSQWKQLVPAEPGARPDVIVREAPARESVFRAAVKRKGVLITDIVQVWLDVSSHPARGREQAALIRRKVLDSVMSGR